MHATTTAPRLLRCKPNRASAALASKLEEEEEEAEAETEPPIRPNQASPNRSLKPPGCFCGDSGGLSQRNSPLTVSQVLAMAARGEGSSIWGEICTGGREA